MSRVLCPVFVITECRGRVMPLLLRAVGHPSGDALLSWPPQRGRFPYRLLLSSPHLPGDFFFARALPLINQKFRLITTLFLETRSLLVPLEHCFMSKNFYLFQSTTSGYAQFTPTRPTPTGHTSTRPSTHYSNAPPMLTAMLPARCLFFTQAVALCPSSRTLD